MKLHTIVLLLVISALISACDPDFQDTSTLCANVPTTASGIFVNDFSVSSGGDYPLYLEDILFAFEPDPSQPTPETGTAEDAEAARNFVFGKINEYLDYTSNNGVVTSANNPLDFIEELITTTDDDRKIGVFQEARDQMARAIAADDDFCNYTNRNFVVNKGPDENNIEEQLFVEFSLSYSPFTRVVQQAVLATRTQEALLSSQERAAAPFVGFWQASPESFTAEGYTPPILRQAIMNNNDETEIFNLDDGFDTRLGVMEFIIKDQVCYPNDDAEKPGDLQACDDGVQTRTVQKAECAGDPDDAEDDGETNKIAYNSFNVNGSNSDVKRVRVETDYVAQRVRIYISPYIEAIENPHKEDGEPDIIYDPTDCEKQAVFDELVEANGGDRTGISLPVVGDTNYDITFTGDDDNLEEVEPNPAIVYQGQLLTERQSEL